MSEIKTDMAPEALAMEIEEAAVQGCVAFAGWEEMELVDQGDALLMLTDIPFAIFNGVIRTSFTLENVDRRVADVLDVFRGRGLPMLWWIAPSCLPKGLGAFLGPQRCSLAGVTAGMALDLSLLDGLDQGHPPPAGLEIREALDDADLEKWRRIMAPVFDFPEFAAEKWRDMHKSLGLGPGAPWRHWVAYLGGKPVATSSVFLGTGVAAVANVATSPGLRKKGIGRAVTLAPLIAARDMGLKIGTLCASEMGLPIYERIGFKTVCEMGCHFHMGD